MRYVFEQPRFRQDAAGEHFVAYDERLHETVLGHLHRYGNLALVRGLVAREIDALRDADPEAFREVRDVCLGIGRAVGANARRDLAHESQVFFDLLDARNDRRLILRTLAIPERPVGETVCGKARGGCPLRSGYRGMNGELNRDRCCQKRQKRPRLFFALAVAPLRPATDNVTMAATSQRWR